MKWKSRVLFLYITKYIFFNLANYIYSFIQISIYLLSIYPSIFLSIYNFVLYWYFLPISVRFYNSNFYLLINKAIHLSIYLSFFIHIFNLFIQINISIYLYDQTERHDFWPWLWIFFSPFLFPPKKKREQEKENELATIEIKRHAFQPGLFIYLLFYLSIFISNYV